MSQPTGQGLRLFDIEADITQMALFINPTLCCHYFLPGPRLPKPSIC